MTQAAHDSIAPAARTLTRLWRLPFVRWLLGLVGAALVASFTTGLWPVAKGWMVTRASDDDVKDVSTRVAALELEHSENAGRLRSAGSDYQKLNHGERVSWLIDRHVEQRRRVVEGFRRAASLEAELRMIAPAARTEAARRKAAQVRARYDEYILKGMEPEAASSAALTDLGF